jgi:hypothetical protein
MQLTWKSIIWDQFGAAIDMLEAALQACPGELWQARLLGAQHPLPSASD